MLGVEVVSDRQLKTPAKAEVSHVMDQMKGTRPDKTTLKDRNFAIRKCVSS